jgi:tetratricopeptide (TPR) repeat protein
MESEDLKNAETKLKDREKSPENIELAEKEFLELSQSYPDKAKIFGLLSKLYYQKTLITPTSTHLALHEKGIEYGKKGILINPENIDSNFWLGVNYGMSAIHKGLISSYAIIEPTDKYLSKSVSLDPSYFFGGPERAFGWFFYQIPPWPVSKGDNKKAIEHLLKSLSYCANFFMTHYYLMKVYTAVGDKKKARIEADWLINTEPVERYKNEDGWYKEQAKIQLNLLR